MELEYSKEQYYSIQTVAQMFDISERTIRRLIASRNIKTVRVGRCIRIPESELHRIAVPIQASDDILEKWLIS